MFTKSFLIAAIAAVAIATAHGASQSSRGVVLTPKAFTPCMSACDDPASPLCQNCCRTVTHETDWGCQATAGSSTTASCCTGDWDATCWNVASAANNDHACNQCGPSIIPSCKECIGENQLEISLQLRCLYVMSDSDYVRTFLCCILNLKWCSSATLDVRCEWVGACVRACANAFSTVQLDK